MKIDKTDWVLTRLDDVAYWYQKDIPNSQQVAAGIQYYLTADHIDSDAVTIKRYSNLVDGQKGPTISKHFEKGDLLFSTRSTLLHKAAIAPVAGVTGEKLLVIRVKPDSELITELLPFVMQSAHFWHFAINSSAGSVNKFTSWTKIREYEFLLPPRDQQARLAELLWAADEVLTVQESSLQKLTAFYSLTRDDLAQGSHKKYPERHYNDLLKTGTPIGLSVKSLGGYLKDIRYGTSVKSNNEAKGRPVLRIPNVVEEKISLDDLAYVELSDSELQKSKLSFGDILIVRTNGNPSYVGRSALFDLEDDYTFASYLIKISPDVDKILPEFISRYLHSSFARKYFHTHATSSAGNFNINTQTIQALPIIEFDTAYQEHAVSVLKLLENAIDECGRTLSQTKTLELSLINQIFSA